MLTIVKYFLKILLSNSDVLINLYSKYICLELFSYLFFICYLVIVICTYLFLAYKKV